MDKLPSQKMFSDAPPAARLVGHELEGGWKVVATVDRSQGATGGHFSFGYIVEQDGGRRGFLKALNFLPAFHSDDPTEALELMTSQFNFERRITELCRKRKMSRVVHAVAVGTVKVDEAHLLNRVQYLIFELAECDLRGHLDDFDRIDDVWLLRSLHQIASGLAQLHSNGIAHQDLKPSNVLIFDRTQSKIADLGRASLKGVSSPFDELKAAGDLSYAPPELLYGDIPGDWRMRRLGCDFYLLGSMIAFYFLQMPTTALIMSFVPEAVRWWTFKGGYAEVLPMLNNAMDQVVDELRSRCSSILNPELPELFRQLCHPDPSIRGVRATNHLPVDRYSLPRVVSRLDLLATRAEYDFLRSAGP